MVIKMDNMIEWGKKSSRITLQLHVGPSFFPIFAHPGFSGFKIIDPRIPGLFRDIFLLNKTSVAVVFQVTLVSYFFHMLTKHL